MTDDYTLKEIAKKYNIQYRTLVREVHRGNLKALRKGGVFIVSADDFANYKAGFEVVRSLQVIVILVIRDDEMLIVKRKYPEGKLLWQNPSGLFRNNGRRIEDQVFDVCKNETNANIKLIKKIGARISPDTKASLSYYLCEYIDGEVFNSEPHENIEVRWIKRKEALTYFTSTVYERLSEYFK